MRHIPTMVLACSFLLLSSCASKQSATQIAQLETQNEALHKKLKDMQEDVESLQEQMILLKTAAVPTSSDPIVLKPSDAPKKVEPRVFDDRNSFFEEDIEMEEETLVFTNEDLDNIQWGTPSAATAPKAKNPKASATPAKKEYQAAYQAFREGKYAKSRSMMLGFIDKYPAHSLTDNAHFWVGESYYVQKQYDTANMYFKNVIRDFPAGNKVPDSMLRSANCAMKQSQDTIAKQSLLILIDKYPKTVAAAKAKKTLQTLR